MLAANVDRLWIVQALDTPPNLRSLERYLAVGWESGASPEIVLTKSDLAEGLNDAVEQVQGVAFGVPLWVTSVTDSASLEGPPSQSRRGGHRGATRALWGGQINVGEPAGRLGS